MVRMYLRFLMTLHSLDYIFSDGFNILKQDNNSIRFTPFLINFLSFFLQNISTKNTKEHNKHPTIFATLFQYPFLNGPFRQGLEYSRVFELFKQQQENEIEAQQLLMDIQKSAEDWKKDGNTAFAAKNYQKAIAAYSEAIKLNPKDHSYFSNRATAYYNLGDYLKCISDCQNANSIKTNFTKTLRRKGLACQQILKFQEAVNSFKSALEYEKDIAIRNELEQAESLKSNYDRYVAALERNDYVECLSCINYLVNKVPQNEKLKEGKVECLAKTGETTDALTLLKTIRVGIDQSVPQFWYLKGIIELYGGESSRAKKFFTEGMRLDPDHKKCRLALNTAKKCELLKEEGNQLLKSGKFQQAEQKYSEAINLDPSNKKLNAIIYSNRALTFMKRKETFKALDDLNKSLQLNPNYDKSLIRRADLNFERGEYTAAIMDYNKIQQLDPNVNLSAKIKQAKKKEKQSKKKDYYKILEVDRNASDQQIKKSYKRLALLYHPDRNRNKSQAQQQETSRKFKEVAEAYGCLSDPKKKQMYDTGQIDYDGDQGSAFGGMGGGIDPTEMFKMFFGGGGGMGGFGGMGGGDDFGFGGGRGGHSHHGGGNQKFSFRFG